MLATVLSGCFSWLQRLDGARGEIVFHDTNLGVRSSVVLGDERIATTDGRLAVSLSAGVHKWSALTLLGQASGQISYSGSGQFRLRVREFTGWSPALFDQLLIDRKVGVTKRWDYGKTVLVWIQPGSHVGRETAQRALSEWEQVLGHYSADLGPPLRFQVTGTESRAQMTIRFVNSLEYDGSGGNASEPHGLCIVRWDPATGRIQKAEVQILNSYADHLGLLRHEIGHCIGLQHSGNKDHLMYRTVSTGKGITEVESNYARLLYSIGRTQRLSTGPLPLSLPDDEGHVEYLPDGLVVQMIPDWVE